MKLVRVASRILTFICAILIVALMLLMVAEVARRTFFNRSILGSTEWAQVLLVCNLSAFSASVLSNRQIKVDILTTRFKPKNKVILEIITLTLTFLTVALLSWQQFIYTMKSFNSHIFYNNINLPQWPFVAIFAFSYGVAALTVLFLKVN